MKMENVNARVQTFDFKKNGKMTPLNLKLCNYSDFRQLLVIGRGMFWGGLGCASEEIGMSQDLQMQESESGAQTRPVYDAGVHWVGHSVDSKPTVSLNLSADA